MLSVVMAGAEGHPSPCLRPIQLWRRAFPSPAFLLVVEMKARWLHGSHTAFDYALRAHSGFMGGGDAGGRAGTSLRSSFGAQGSSWVLTRLPPPPSFPSCFGLDADSYPGFGAVFDCSPLERSDPFSAPGPLQVRTFFFSVLESEPRALPISGKLYT